MTVGISTVGGSTVEGSTWPWTSTVGISMFSLGVLEFGMVISPPLKSPPKSPHPPSSPPPPPQPRRISSPSRERRVRLHASFWISSLRIKTLVAALACNRVSKVISPLVTFSRQNRYDSTGTSKDRRTQNRQGINTQRQTSDEHRE